MSAMDDDDQTVCWLEQKLDEVDSYLMSAASPELEPLLPLEAVTSSPPARPVEGVPVEESKEVTREEEAFLQLALIDAEADSNEEEVIIVDEEEEALLMDEDWTVVDAEGESKEENSLQLQELESVVSKLGTAVRLRVRDALYRLAGSAAMRQGLHETTESSTPSRLGGTTEEACTNLFDRTIANLLFHRSTQASQTQQSASTTSSNVPAPTPFAPDAPVKMPFPPVHKHRCAVSREVKKPVMNRLPSQAVVTKKLPAVMTNKQLDVLPRPSRLPIHTKQPVMTTTKASDVASVTRKLPEYSVQGMVPKKVASFAEKRRRPMSSTTSRKRVKLL